MSERRATKLDATMVHVSGEILAALDRLVLSGQPTGEGAQVAVGNNNVIIEGWPLTVRIGPHVLRLTSIYYKNGAQEAMYERRC